MSTDTKTKVRIFYPYPTNPDRLPNPYNECYEEGEEGVINIWDHSSTVPRILVAFKDGVEINLVGFPFIITKQLKTEPIPNRPKRETRL